MATVAALALTTVLAAHTLRAQNIMWYKIPDPVQESFHLAHPALPKLSFVHWARTDVGYCARYGIPYNRVTSLFQENGEWVSTRWTVPEAQLPLAAHDFISSKYAFYTLRSCTYEEDRWAGRHYYVLFSIRGIDGYMTEVCFDMQGNVVGIDGQTEQDWDEFEPLNEEEVLLLLANQSLHGDMIEDEGEWEDVSDSEPLSDSLDWDGDGIKELPIGFFAWKEDYEAMRQRKREQQMLKTMERQEKRAQTAERRQWLTRLFKKKETSDSAVMAPTVRPPEQNLAQDYTVSPQESTDKEQQRFSREKERQTKKIYRPQSRRDFEYAKVLNQSRVAQKRRKRENDALAENAEAVSKPVAEKPVEVATEPAVGGAATGTPAPEQPARESAVGAATEQTVSKPVAEKSVEVATEPAVGGAATGTPAPEQPARESAVGAPAPVIRTSGMRTSMGTAAPTLGITAKTLFPDHIQQAFNKRFPKAENPKYFRDTNNNYRAVFVNFGQKAEAVFLPDGTHITTALFFGKKEVSYPIQLYIESCPNKPKFVTGKRIVYESRYRGRFAASEKPQNYFEVVVWEKNKEDRSRIYYLLRFDHKGHFVSSTPYDYVGSRL